ncbi:MAG: PEP/pyruvate-binding domain-containing protein, partial [Flavobacteriales bacterium]
LSHVNLRAIQDNVPNAYIENPLLIDSIANLLGNYVYYKVENEQFQIREATLDEVNDWYEDLRPTEPQIPVRDLSITQILALDDIAFDMSTAFGAKCSNVATMRSFGLPSGTIPDGFGIPFYYYDEFMQFNNFYEEAQVMIDNPTFQTDINFRIERLKDFRKDIKDAPMPQWMLDDLQAMHDDFPVGTAVRCRSSTNNEDLPGFSGAGLYTSKTQHLDEGHIQKSIKQVYASMWNFRAYEERDFYRVDHFVAAMGILCHPNFEEEKSNGVGISIDPIYETDSTYYLNTQAGESLITNPDPNTVPEEILLYQNPLQGGGFLVLGVSNLVDPGELIMNQAYLDQMRTYLSVIHNEFAILYDVVDIDGFGMDIEYKVTAQDQLVIKQARPWVSFWADITANNDLGVTELVEPQSSSSLGNNELVTATIANQGINDMSDFEISLLIDGQLMETITITDTIHPFSQTDFQFSSPQDFSTIGDYNITGVVSDTDDEYGNNDTLNVVLSKLHVLDGELSIGQLNVECNDEVKVNAIITNLGDATITDVEIEVIVNGFAVDVIVATVNIPFQDQASVAITISDSLQEIDNNITLNLLNVNSQVDGDLTNNSATATTTLDSDHDIITLIINADNYPGETSWELYDEGANQIVAGGDLPVGAGLTYTEDICLDYTSCFSLSVYDSYGDGICCAYGIGDFLMLNALGDTIVMNDGEFTYEAQEVFCPDGTGCDITAAVNVSNSSSISADDGAISINPNSGLNPFQYSIDNGQTFVDSNTFNNLAPGNYTVMIQDTLGFCSYQETVSIEICTFTTVDIESTDASSVVTTDGSIVINPTSGVGPYQYSIDGGQNFVASNVFPNLPVGPYNVIVQDASNICLYEVVVPIEVCIVDVGIVTTNASTESSTDGAISIYPAAGTSLFQYSIDGGQNFLSSHEFINLSAGTYVIVVQELSGSCAHQDTVTIEADNLSVTSNTSANGIKVYPNPTNSHVNIEIESFSSLTDDIVNIEIYNNLGKTIQTSSISKLGSKKTILSLEGYASGTYFIKCYNNTFEEYFKVIKIYSTH